MPNMSYCRFQNTAADLRDCYENWDGEDEDLSDEELRARKWLLQLCQQIVGDYGYDDED